KSLREFGKQAWRLVDPSPYQDSWVTGCLAEHLQAVEELQIKRLLLMGPPRHGKSIWEAVLWPCWSWARDPASRWLCITYADHLALRDANRSRNLIKSRWYQERWGHVYRLRKDQDAKGFYENDKLGARISSIVGGMATGEGASHLVIDDPLKEKDS